jgi:hypothetical protein
MFLGDKLFIRSINQKLVYKSLLELVLKTKSDCLCRTERSYQTIKHIPMTRNLIEFLFGDIVN